MKNLVQNFETFQNLTYLTSNNLDRIKRTTFEIEIALKIGHAVHQFLKFMIHSYITPSPLFWDYPPIKLESTASPLIVWKMGPGETTHYVNPHYAIHYVIV